MPRSAPLFTAAGLTALCAALVLRAGATPEPVPASAPVGEFSSERALRHAREIAQRPHPSGSDDHARVRAYLVAQLRALGLEPQLQEATAVGTRYPVAGHVVNVMARLPGRTPGGKAVLLAAHYDGVWASPAAGDDGSGTSAMLETLRALRAGTPLEHDVIALISDGEEAGLLGAAAFVREHPWARDVAVVLDFEARGTEGRSLMFETGAGNLDVARVLRTLPDVSAGSLMVTIYRSLPNDTDLSELSLLNTPALNFAFVDGVERYHTGHDDLAHLDPGSVQHHGMQMLALARAFANGPLPRPATGDAVFFEAPVLGLVVYPESWALPLAILVALGVGALVGRTARREARGWRGLALGAAGMLLAATAGALAAPRIASALVSLHASAGWDGAPSWRAGYAAALALLALAGAAAIWAVARRWASAAALHAGALMLWVLLALVSAARLPGASYLFAWPPAAVALAAWLDRGEAMSRAAMAARAIATLVAGALLVPVIHSTGAYTLPLDGPGGLAVGALVPMLAWLLAPQLEALGAAGRWRSAGLMAAASLVVMLHGMATVRRTVAYPTLANLRYATSVDADSAWLTATARFAREGEFAAITLGPLRRTLPAQAAADSSIGWLYDANVAARGTIARGMARTIADGPEATVVADSVTGGKRRLTVRVRAPHGTLAVVVGGSASMRALAVDGRLLDTTRYRSAPAGLAMPFTAPPDSGFTIVIELPRDTAAVLRLTAATPGLPPMAGITVPARPDDVVPVQNGDVTVRYRRVVLPRIDGR